jgi:hypothetical protein
MQKCDGKLASISDQVDAQASSEAQTRYEEQIVNKERFVGLWRFVSWETRRSDNEGEHL